MEVGSNVKACERGDDLIAYLYGEVAKPEAEDFELHLRGCKQCKDDLGSFRQVRDSIVEWRNESLGSFASYGESSKAADVRTGFERGKPSVVAAVRAFLDLSPLWMKIGVAFATVAICAAAVLAGIRLFAQPAPAMVAGDKRYSETELKAKIEEALAKERNQSVKDEVSTPLTADENEQDSRRAVDRSPQGLVTDHKSRQRPLTRLEREQLAADLRLVSTNEETDFEFLDDRINR